MWDDETDKGMAKMNDQMEGLLLNIISLLGKTEDKRIVQGENMQWAEQCPVYVLRCFNCIRLFATNGLQPTRLLYVGFSRQEYYSGLPCLPPWDLPDPGIEPMSLMSPALPDGFFTTSASQEAQIVSLKKVNLCPSPQNL